VLSGVVEDTHDCCWVWMTNWRDKAAFHPSQSRNPNGLESYSL